MDNVTREGKVMDDKQRMSTHYTVKGERFDSLADAVDAAVMRSRLTDGYTDIYQVDDIAGRPLSQVVAYADERGEIIFDAAG